MCKKLMFLISFVLLISWGAVAPAADLIVGSGETHTVSGSEDYEEVTAEDGGVIISPSGSTLTMSNRDSIINGGLWLVDGGDVTANCRFNIGDGDGGTLIVQNGGSFTQACPGDDCDDGFKLPDNSGGTTKMYIYNGTVTNYTTEMRPGRLNTGDGGGVGIGRGAVLRTCDVSDGMSDQYRYDPRIWLDNGWMFPIDGVTVEQIDITVDGDCIVVEGPPACEDKASAPNPADGEKGVASVISDVELSWQGACGIGSLGRHYVFFSTDKDCVDNAPSYSIGWTPPDCYVAPPLFAGVTSKNMGNFPNWTVLYWRIDQKLETGEMVKGDTWKFTTGCDPVPTGDCNLDCLVNLDDWALLLTTMGDEQFFPWD
ncbi:MAG: hypothetical protein ACYSR4_11370 [Planctomycetota bacterium]|jgi:hypothetical protein